MKILIFIIIVLVVSTLLIAESNDLNIYEKEDFKKLSEAYGNWTNELYSNVRQMTGHATKLNWLPE